MSSSGKAPAPSPDTDVLLLPFLEASTDKEEDLFLIQLLDEHISPIVRPILRYKLQYYFNERDRGFLNQDIEDAYNEIQLRLLERLRDLKSHPGKTSVANLRGYVATTARNACDEYLRRMFPQRRKLKDRIRYCLTSNPDLVLCETAGKGWLVGLAEWKTHSKLTSPANNQPSKIDLLESISGKLRNVDLQRMELHDLITSIVKIHGIPVELDHLTAVVAKLLGIEDHPLTSFDVVNDSLAEPWASDQAGSETLAEYHQLLEQLWLEILRLPRRQRVALLCNLKSPHGINVITLFPTARVASFEQLAEALELPLDEFEKLWSNLPIDDLSLAEYLGITRQQVINLRRSARDRLMRRMKTLEGKNSR